MRIRLRVLLLGGAGALALCAAGAASAFAAGPDTTHATNRPSTAAALVQQPAISQTGPVVAVHTTMPGGPAPAPRTMPVARAVPMHHPAPSKPEGRATAPANNRRARGTRTPARPGSVRRPRVRRPDSPRPRSWCSQSTPTHLCSTRRLASRRT